MVRGRFICKTGNRKHKHPLLDMNQIKALKTELRYVSLTNPAIRSMDPCHLSSLDAAFTSPTLLTPQESASSMGYTYSRAEEEVYCGSSSSSSSSKGACLAGALESRNGFG
jgi:hypothetical protein